MSVISSALSVLAFFLSCGALFFSARSATAVRELQDRLHPLPLSRLSSLETSLADTQGALAEVVNRVKMMKVRNAANHVKRETEEPDPYKDPDLWRQMMNRKIGAKFNS